MDPSISKDSLIAATALYTNFPKWARRCHCPDKDETFSQEIYGWIPFRRSLADPIGAPAMIGRDYRPSKPRFFSTESTHTHTQSGLRRGERWRMSDIVGYRGSEKR